MLEVGKCYTKAEMTNILGTSDTEGIRRKLIRYNVVFSEAGWADRRTYTIREIQRPFKLYAILDLGCDANTDFVMLAHYYHYFFNDDEFRAMPDEVKECWMEMAGFRISRQTIAKYTQRIVGQEMVARQLDDCVYYFAHKNTQIMTDRETYCQAWREYWAAVSSGMPSPEAIYEMKCRYGGVARKQPKVAASAFYTEEIQIICDLAAQVVEG